MPCEPMQQDSATARAREAAIKELAEDIKACRRKITRNVLTGEVSITSWATSSAKAAGWCQGCCATAVKAHMKGQPIKAHTHTRKKQRA